MKENRQLPHFSSIDFSQVSTKLDAILTQNKEKIAELLQQRHFSWENLMQPMEELHDQLHRFWAPISHLNSVVSSETLRRVHHDCLPKLSSYYTELTHNQALYRAIQSIADAPTFSDLSKAQQKVISNEIRDFKLSGVTLPAEQKKKFAALVTSLDQLHTQFEENLLDATNDWFQLVTDKKDIAGIPATALAQAKQRAEENGQQGWRFNLEAPCYLAVMNYADSRELRQTMYRAYATRASDQADNKKFDNSALIEEIPAKRLEMAQLLGFENYAQQSLATKMVSSPEKALDFLYQLADASRKKAQQEYQELLDFARDKHHVSALAAWDNAYYAEKLRQQEYAISQEALRPYFSEENVIAGLFAIVKRLYNIDVKPLENVDTWHPDVRCYAVYNSDHQCISYCYFDLYARPQKRGGAWMDDCCNRRKRSNGEIQLPIAFVTCNFNAPTATTPALFTHDEVITLFHEFGHALQHMLTTVDYAGVAGINGIPWDAVELASQFLENWAWYREPLSLFAKHYETGEPLPEALYQKMFEAKNFQSAMQMMRQLEFSIFDMLLHIHFDPSQKEQVHNILTKTREEISVIPVPDFNRFQHGFSHIFSGGYAAGYYSYKWAEVMASDAFSVFLEKGIFDTVAANNFLTYILQPGGSEDPATLYQQYRGREARIESLLEQSGIY